MKAAAIDDDELAKARRNRFESLQCHKRSPRIGSKPRGHVDLVALREGHNGLLPARLDAARAFEHFALALADKRVDGCDLDVEEMFDRSFDFWLRRVFADLKNDLICLRRHCCLF